MTDLNLKHEYLEFLNAIKTKTKFQRVLIASWILMPFLMMLSKSMTDAFITLIAFSFLIRSIIKFSWSWVKINWVKWALLFFASSIISASLSLFVEISIGNGLSWARFPIFAVAISYWLIKEKQILFIALFTNFLALLFIFLLMSLESMMTNHEIFTWPFRNPLNGPFIHRIGIIFYCISVLNLFSNSQHKLFSIFFILISLFFSLLSGHRVGTFSFVIIILICTFWPNFNLKKSIIITFGFLFLLLVYFIFNPNDFDRYFVDVINLTNSSLLQYIGLWKTGANAFIDNPFVGLGPTNVQNYLEINLIENFDPFNNSEHPHNHYLQAFAETGVFGGVFYCLMAMSIIFNFYKITKLKLSYINSYFSYSIFITSICLFWPFSNGHDLFGQQQNSYLWYVLSLIMVLGCILKISNRESNN